MMTQIGVDGFHVAWVGSATLILAVVVLLAIHLHIRGVEAVAVGDPAAETV